MNPNSRMRPGSSKSSWDDSLRGQVPKRFSTDPSQSLAQVAKTLAAHGGGEASMGLAFDLVLNDVVENARDATGATGAAIALLRDGELVCRATTRDGAPDLGVRVETRSGLAAACLSTGQIQQCRDTETDPRVNAEASRRLGVRSMLIAPLFEGPIIFGIVQVFSAWPNAFGEREIYMLRGLAERIAETKKEAEAGVADTPATVEEEPESFGDSSRDAADITAPGDLRDRVESTRGKEDNLVGDSAIESPQKTGKADVWSATLVVLVIATAVVLGIVVGWHGAAKVGSGDPAKVSTTTPAQPQKPMSAETISTVADSLHPSAAAVPTSDAKPTASSNSESLPSGGLIVTDSGKVIYRQPRSNTSAATRPTTHLRELIHRVEPQYPPEARAQNVQGSVVLIVEIHGDGSVGDIAVASGDPVLTNAAVRAVKQWRYQPYYVDGNAVESETRITVKFTLPPA